MVIKIWVTHLIILTPECINNIYIVSIHVNHYRQITFCFTSRERSDLDVLDLNVMKI
nr:MAG TPA: hypothetical protein [Caudoviricetes sp.]